MHNKWPLPRNDFAPWHFVSDSPTKPPCSGCTFFWVQILQVTIVRKLFCESLDYRLTYAILDIVHSIWTCTMYNTSAWVCVALDFPFSRLQTGSSFECPEYWIWFEQFDLLSTRKKGPSNASKKVHLISNTLNWIDIETILALFYNLTIIFSFGVFPA